MDIQKLRLIIDSSAAKSGADEFKRSTDAVAAGATSATGSITKMESALDATARTARTSTDAVQKTAVTTEQARQAWEKSGGSLQKFAKELEKIAGLQKQVTDSTQAMGRAQVQAMEMDERMTRNMALAHAEAIAMDEKLGQTVNATGAGLGRLRMGFTSLNAQLTGTNPLLDRIVATFGSMSIGMAGAIAALASLALVGVIYKAFTEETTQAQVQQDKLTKSLEEWYKKEREGPSGNFGKEIDAETEKVKKLQGILDAAQHNGGGFGTVNAAAAASGGSKAMGWVRVFADAISDVATGGDMLVQEIKTNAAKINIAINDGFAAIHAANVKAHNDIQRQQADALANLIASNHATAVERAKARQTLQSDITELARLDRLAQTTNGGTKVDQQQRVALAEEIKKLTDALDPPKLVAAEDHLAGVRDQLKRMQDEAKQFGAEASINTRTQAIIDDLDRLEKKFPKLTDQIEQMKSDAVTAGDALKQAVDAKVTKQIDDAYTAQKALSDAMHDHNGSLRDLTASKRADLEIDRIVLQLGHDITDAEKEKIHYTYENAAALNDEAQAARKSAEDQKQARQKVLAEQKHDYDQMQRETARFFDDIYKKGFKSFTDLFGVIKDLFAQMLADMEAKWVMKHVGASVLGAFGVGSGGNSANPKLWEAGLAAALTGGVAGYSVGQSMPSGTTAALGGAASGAAMGAMLGSVVPVLGTAVGAVVGAVGGLVGGLLGHASKVREEASKLKAAREQFAKELDSFTYNAGVHSDLDSSLHALTQNFIELQKKAKDLKLSTGALAEAQTAENAAQIRLRQEFLASIDAQIRAAGGTDYINQAIGFQKSYEQNLKDIALAGGNTNKAAELFTKQMEQLGATLDSDQLKALLTELPNITKGMDPVAIEALAKALGDDLAKALATLAAQTAQVTDALTRASEDLQTRYARAIGSSTADTLARQFGQREEIFQAQQSGATPEYMAQLRLVQLYETSQATVQKQIADQTKVLQDQLNTEQSTLATAQQTLQATQRVVDTLTQYRQSLLTGSLSTLNPEQQVQEAKRQVLDAFTKAMSGDKDAAGNFSQLSTSFLDLLQKNQASGPLYATGFSDVTGMLDQLQQKYGAQLSIDQTAAETAQKQVDLLTQQIAQLSDVSYQETLIRQEVVQQLQAQQNDAAKAAADAIAQLKLLQSQNDSQLAYAQTQVDKLGALFDQAAANGDANASVLYNQWQTAIQLRDSALATRDKIADQIEATQKAADAANAASVDLIASINSGQDLNAQGQAALQAELTTQRLRAEVHHTELIAQLVLLQDSMVSLLQTGFHIGPNDTDPSVPINVHTFKVAGTDATAADIANQQAATVAAVGTVADLLRGIRTDAAAANQATVDRMQQLVDEFGQLVQITRFANRDAAV